MIWQKDSTLQNKKQYCLQGLTVRVCASFLINYVVFLFISSVFFTIFSLLRLDVGLQPTIVWIVKHSADYFPGLNNKLFGQKMVKMWIKCAPEALNDILSVDILCLSEVVLWFSVDILCLWICLASLCGHFVILWSCFCLFVDMLHLSEVICCLLNYFPWQNVHFKHCCLCNF